MSECFDLSFSFHSRAPGFEALDVGDAVWFVYPCITSPATFGMFDESGGGIV